MPERERNKQATLLGLQWAFWKHLQFKLVMDGDRMSKLCEDLARDVYAEGVRITLADDAEEMPLTISADIISISREIGPIAMPDKRLRERAAIAGRKLYERGYRKFASSAALLTLFEGVLR